MEPIQWITEDNYAGIPRSIIRPFDKVPVAATRSEFNLKPTWGISELRYNTSETTGTGAATTEEGGEFKLTTGTTTGNVAAIRTLGRTQYFSGSFGRWGWGIRMPTAPVSTQDFYWGFFDDDNGLMFGQDSTGIYVNRRSGGTDNKEYKSSWNIDKLDGTGPSALTLSDFSDGYITQCDFTWYGYGPAIFYILIWDSAALEYKRVPVHAIKVSGLSIVDPNQPLHVYTTNGASSTTSTDVFVGGHQFEVIGADAVPQERRISQLLTNFTTATNTDWQPILAIRPKANHGTSGRTNSVLVRPFSYQVNGNGEMETRITVGGTTSNLSWATPTGWTSAESAAEVKVTGGTALTTSADGFPFSYDYLDGTNKTSGQSRIDLEVLELGQDEELILWIRRLSGSGGIIVKHANIQWLEEW